MSQVDFKTNKIKACECGYKPLDYTVGYGPTPIYISCLGCGKSLHGGQGMPDATIRMWNNGVRFLLARKQMLHISNYTNRPKL